MGFSVPGILSGAKNFVCGVAQDGENFARALAGAGGAVVNKALDVGVPLAGTLIEDGCNLIPKPVVNAALGGVERGVDAGAFVVQHTPGIPSKAKSLAGDLARVNLQGVADTSGLKGDWGSLYYDWLFEMTPASLGKWDTVIINGQVFDRCTFTDLSYASDLSKLGPQQDAARLLTANGPPQVGDTVTIQWQYTGEGTSESGTEYGLVRDGKGNPQLFDAQGKPYDPSSGEPHGPLHYVARGGHYGTMENFIGSYTVTAKVVGVDQQTGQATLRVHHHQ